MAKLLPVLFFLWSPLVLPAVGDPLPPPLPSIKIEPVTSSPKAPVMRPLEAPEAPCKVSAKKLSPIPKEGKEIFVQLSAGWRTCVKAIMSDDWIIFERQSGGLLLRISPNPRTQRRVGELLLQGTSPIFRIEVVQDEGDYDSLEDLNADTP